MEKLAAELVLEISVRCGQALEVGEISEGLLRVIPILGGQVQGRIRGTVVPGGADWNTLRQDGLAHVMAKYTLYTEDGEYISVANEGIIQNAGEGALIKTNPRFQARRDSLYDWLNHGVYVGSLEPGEKADTVEIRVYRLA